jgi:ankyrin repeat protein
VGDIRGDTCIHAAAISNQTTGLEFLVTCEANPNIANNEGLTPAHLATNSKSLDVMHEAGACLYCIDLHSRMPLWYACKEGRTSCVQSLCKATPIEYISFPDDEGNTPLHMACLGGHSDIVEILCQYIHNYNDYYIVNKKGYTPIHLAANSEVLKKLYEYGVELWVFDAKFRYPLFVSCFHGRVDCVTFLMEIGMQRDMSLITKKDKQGDTALHVASLCGHIKCVSLLLFVCNSEPNSQGFTPEILAERAGHTQLSSFIKSVMEHKNNGYSTLDIFQCTFNNLSSVLLYYGSRWTKLYDIHSQVVYYFDRVLGASQWHRPDSYDELPINEMNTDKARDILINFYTLYNPEKLYQINEILHVYDNKFPELFIQLANRYEVQDLSIFKM